MQGVRFTQEGGGTRNVTSPARCPLPMSHLLSQPLPQPSENGALPPSETSRACAPPLLPSRSPSSAGFLQSDPASSLGAGGPQKYVPTPSLTSQEPMRPKSVASHTPQMEVRPFASDQTEPRGGPGLSHNVHRPPVSGDKGHFLLDPWTKAL